MTDVDRTPKGETLRKYYPNSCLTNDELHELAKSYAIIAGIKCVRPSKNKDFGVMVRFSEIVKKKHGELRW